MKASSGIELVTKPQLKRRRVYSTAWSWLNDRLPIQRFLQKNLSRFYVSKHLNIWYIFGSIALVVLLNQIVTGIWLAMNYTPTADGAFASIEYIMRDVRFGWLLRYLHSTGASAFFIIIYLHIFRAFLYASYRRPRELVWLIGMGLYLALMAEAFMGYLLPWGQMSYWGAEVITSLFGAIPVVGHTLVEWIRGDYGVSDVTLHRFYALHIIVMPLAILVLVWVHITALHYVGSGSPTGLDVKLHGATDRASSEGIPFHPYYTVKDLLGVAVFLLVFCSIVFFAPDMGGYFLEPTNFIPANPLQTPTYLSPLWYFTPFYAMLRAVPNKLFGVTVMAAAIAILFTLPWLDRRSAKAITHRSIKMTVALTCFVVSFVGLGYLGLQPVTVLYTWVARVLTGTYFLFFIMMPLYTLSR